MVNLLTVAPASMCATLLGRFTATKRLCNVAPAPSICVPLLPLEGFVIGVTADRRWGEQAELLERRGAAVFHAPTISTEYLGSDDALRIATEAVIADPPDYLVATTGIGVRAWFESVQVWGLADKLLAALTATRVVARGPKAAAAVQVAGLPIWATPASERLDEVVERLTAEVLHGRTVAFQHYGKRDARAVDAITACGATVVEVPVYRYEHAADETRALALIDAVCAGRIDAVTFTSAPAIRSLVATARRGERDAELIRAFNGDSTTVACVGPVCAEAARGAGIERPVAPAVGRLGLLVRVLTEALQARRKVVGRGPVSFVVQGRAVEIDGTKVDLAPRERAVLDVLLERRGAVVAKPTILRSLGSDPSNVHALEATVARMRRRLGPAGASIRAVRGRGYCLDVDQPATAS